MLRTCCAHNMFWPCSELAIFMYWACNSMNYLLSYCGLVDARIRASDKDLPVQQQRLHLVGVQGRRQCQPGGRAHGLPLALWRIFGGSGGLTPHTGPRFVQWITSTTFTHSKPWNPRVPGHAAGHDDCFFLTSSWLETTGQSCKSERLLHAQITSKS